MNFETKCPLCKIGFMMMCTSKEEAVHMDIMWSSDAGLQQNCQDLEAVKPHIIENKNYGTGFSLSEELNDHFMLLNDRFHQDPSFFNKDTVDVKALNVLIGEFVRYSDYMLDREVKAGTTMDQVVAMFNEGKNLKEIFEAITELDPDVEDDDEL